MTAFRFGLEEKLISYVTERPEVEAAILFGSVARGEDRPESDIDIGILLQRVKTENTVTRSELTTDFLRLCHPRGVDVVILNHARPLLKHRVVRDGRVIFCRNTKALAEFTINAIQQYEDTRRLRDLQSMRLRRKLALVGAAQKTVSSDGPTGERVEK